MVEVSRFDGANSPMTTAEVRLFDGSGLVASQQIAQPPLPGSLLVRGLPDRAQEVRVVVRGETAAGPLLGGARATTQPNAQSTAVVLLSADRADSDGDGVPDDLDDCPDVPDGDQGNTTGGGAGDACRAAADQAQTVTDAAVVSAPDLAPAPPDLACSSCVDPTAWYTVVNQNSGKCVDTTAMGTSNGTLIDQVTCGKGKYSQQWQFVPTDSGFYRVVNRLAGRLWDVTAGDTSWGVQIELWDDNGGQNQQWLPVAVGGGHYRFVARHSILCLDVPSSSTADGAVLQQWDCNGTQAQSFSLSRQP